MTLSTAISTPRWRAHGGRPIPSGAITPRNAAIFTAALCLIGLVILLQFNWFTVALGAASLLLVAAYPFMKRITWCPRPGWA